MKKACYIAFNTFREAARDKIMYVIAFFAVLMMGASLGLGFVSVGERTQIMQHFSLATCSFFGALIAVFVGTGLIYKEIDKRTIYTILSKPVHRWQFILGKFLGLVAVLFCIVLGMSAISCGFVLYSGGAVTPIFLLAAVLVFFEMVVVTAIAIFFSTVSSPILAAIFTFCAYLIGQVTPDLMQLVEFEKPLLNYHLRHGEIADWPQFCKLLDGKNGNMVCARVRSLLQPQAQEAVGQCVTEGVLPPDTREKLQETLNLIIDRKDFYQPEMRAGLDVPEFARELFDAEKLTDNQVQRRNRFLFESAFGKLLAETAKYDTVSHITGEEMTDRVAKAQWLLKPFSFVMYHALPNLTHFQLRNRVVYGPGLKQGRYFVDGEFGMAVIYSLSYSALLLALAALLFDRKKL
jgi:ABC-type transport system involved in multi-copper enzyme maturation permease subunit